MNRGFRVTASIAIALFLLAGTARAQEWRGRGRLQGIVTDEQNQPVAGAKVTLHFGQTTEGPEPLLTDKKGRWSILGLAGGQWSFVIEKDGFNSMDGAVAVSEVAIGPGTPIRASLKVPEAVKKQAEVLGWIDQGNVALKANQYDEARSLYEKALVELQDSSKPPVLRGVASTYYKQGKADEAIKTLQSALTIAPDDVDSLQLMINLLTEQGKEEEARTYIARLPSGEKVSSGTLLNLGIDLYNKHDLDGALKEFERVVAENPTLADGFYYRGLVYLNQGKNDPAKADFEKLLQLAPDYPQAATVKQFLEYLKSQK